MSQNRGCALGLIRGPVAVLALLFIVSFPVSVLFHDLARVIFSAERMTTLLKERLVVSGVVQQLVVESFLGRGTNLDQGDEPAALAHLEPSHMAAIADVLFPPGWIEDQVARVVSDLYAWIDNDLPQPNLSLDVQPLKTRLMSGGAEALIEVIIDSWPPCGLDQVEEIRRNLPRLPDYTELICELPEPYRGDQLDLLAGALRQEVRAMPPKIPLGGERAIPIPGGIIRQKARVRLFRAVTDGIWLVSLSLLGLVVALVVRSWSGLTRWVGALLLLAGGGGGLIAFIVARSGSWFARGLVAGIEAPPRISDMASSVAHGIRDLVLNAYGAHIFLILAMGVVLLISSLILARRSS